MSVIVLTSTNPTLLLNANEKRTKVLIQMQASNVDANNTGRVHLGRGYQPIATVGHPSQGDVLLQGSGIEEPSADKPLDSSWKKSIWATASAINQSLTVEEFTE